MNGANSGTRILYVGYVGERMNRRSRSYQRLVALQELGYDTVAIGVRRDDGDPRPGRVARLIESARTRLGIPVDVTDANRRIVEAATREHFDLVWVEKGIEVFPSTIQHVKTLPNRPKLALWMEEYMRPRGNHSRYSMANLKHYDFVFTPRSKNCDCAWVRGLRQGSIHLVDDTYDLHTHRPDHPDAQPDGYDTDVGFIGTFEKQRARSMLYLAKHGVQVRVWGGNWQTWKSKHANLKIEDGPVYGKEYASTLFRTKINLCFLRKHNADQQTNRTFEIPACGAFMLAERTPDHLRLFREDLEATYFSSNAELLRKVRHYLTRGSERRAIALAGYRHCRSCAHSHHDRMREMLRMMGLRSPVRAGWALAAQVSTHSATFH